MDSFTFLLIQALPSAFSDPPAVPSGWLGAAISADGSTIVAVGDGVFGTMHAPPPVPPAPPSPRLDIGVSGANLGLSWLVSSTSFVLQENSDLVSPNWVDVTNPPTLNCANLHNQVTLPTPPRNTFYRLRQP